MSNPRPLLREKSLAMPEVRNPFVQRVHFTWLEKLQLAVMTVTLFPLRIALIFFFLVLGWGLASIALLGRSKEEAKQPLKGWRNWLRPIIVVFSRAVFFFGGFHWITVKGKLATAEEAPILAVAPHSSFFDALPITFLDLTSVVAKSASESVPFFGKKNIPFDNKKLFVHSDRTFTKPLTLLGQALFYCLGFRVTLKGEQVTADEAPILVLSPHSTFFDIVCGFFTRLPSPVVAKENIEKLPLMGLLTRYTQPVFVSREDPNSRQNTIQEIKRRAQSKGAWPQIVIFPEGTCTNRNSLISFKPGAFYPGVPVQPVCLKYNNKLDTVTWTWEGPDAFHCLLYTLCQFHTNLEVEFLPVYTPNEEEKNDAKLFGRNVRDVMAKALGVPTSDHTYEDTRLMNYASKLELPAATGLVEFAKLSRKLGINYDNMKDMLHKFCSIAQANKGIVTVEEFAKYLDMPVAEPLQEMFDMYDRDGSQTIDFREYVIGLSLVAMPANNEDTIRLAFKVFDGGDKGYITQKELHDILNRTFAMTEVDVHTLFSKVDQDKDGKITYDEFKAFASEKPEYARLFWTYQQLKVRDEEAARQLSLSKLLMNGNSTGNEEKVKAE